jgi:hypothetical protein
MNIFTFRSEGRSLFAFAAMRDGTSLPERHGPWKFVEAVGPGKKMPHAFDRQRVEAALRDNGFQMWRLKPSPGAN